MKHRNPTSLNSEQLLSLLKDKHKRDLFVPECKNGPSWVADNLRRLDAWALRSTWSPWTTVGYEIKVDRNDFEQDQKWVDYLGYCHQFYFVCPSGLIKSNDLAEGVGLLWASPRAQRLHTKVKAVRHEPDHEKLAQLMSYVLMHRARLDDKNQAEKLTRQERMDRYQQQVEEAERRKSLARFINGHVWSVYDRSTRELKEAKEALVEAKEFAKRLDKLGIHWDAGKSSWSQARRVHREIDKLDGHLGEFTRMKIRRAANSLICALDELEKQVGEDTP